jgi:hypothetical protein
LLLALLVGVAGLAVAQGRAGPAARLFGAVEGLRATIGYSMRQRLRDDYERDLATTRAALGEAVFAAAWAAGQALTLDEAVAEALAEVGPATSES